ncbi:hypothetical protein DMN91_005335 [Ooceraea biroi]|uniref:Ankyrin repeat domain-containing protein n=1 Tax=Ooceraea biroi TaxID=2015173 RepID=A0A026VZN9_OOCBI|nr:ankyrin repeat domain-containing protein 27 [Ooceraea biroi]EZA49273.1 Ankyrin repeat domain-containing protein [Ooceraea biroi]RLU23057.1 hypothetical protein DMN91_005335 [Ooceraea biroi]
MNAEYDEDLSENQFLQELKNEYDTTFQRAIQEGWIVCVPRKGSFVDRKLREDEILAHILIPKQDLSIHRFDSLDGSEVLLVDKVLTVEHNDTERYSAQLLFKETFYSMDSHKYHVWCIECPLKPSLHISDSCVNIITNFQEAIHFLVELLDKQLRDDFKAKIKSFLQANKNLECKPVQVQSDLVHELYANCLRMLLENSALGKKASDSKHYYCNIRVSLETYILYALRNVLLKSLSACTAVNDACLNKIIRNLDGIQLSHLQIRSDLQSRIHGGRMELSRLDNFMTVLGKIECLRRAVKYVSCGKSSVSSDDLLPVLVFLVIKAGLSNWMAQLFFMKHFRLSAGSDHEADEAGFLITSLEAVIEYIRSGVIHNGDNLDKLNKLKNEAECSSISHLFACIKSGNLCEVEKILACDASSHVALCHPLCTCTSCEQNWTKHQDLNACLKDDTGDNTNLTALHVAVLYDQIMIVDFFLDRTDINAADSDGLTALHYACMKNHQNILLLLLHENADPRVADSRGNTPLHLAVDRGHESCVKAMLYFSEHMNVPIDPNTANDNGDTPLHLAAKWGYHAIVRILLECGAKCEPTNKKGQTPLAITYNKRIAGMLKCHAGTGDIDSNSIPLSHTLQQPCQLPLQQPPEWAATSLKNKDLLKFAERSKNYDNAVQQHVVDRLLAAITEGDICLACYYLGLEGYREHPSSDVRPCPCHHPLCDCEHCSTAAERKLERKRRRRAIAINACNSLGETALHVASATGRTRMVQLLLDAAANVNVTTKSEIRTPLHLACLNEHIDAAKLLLNCATCDVNAKDCNGDTPLHVAIETGNVKLVALLVRHGVNINARNLQNVNVLQQVLAKLSVVFSDNYASILKILKQNAAELTDD